MMFYFKIKCSYLNVDLNKLFINNLFISLNNNLIINTFNLFSYKKKQTYIYNSNHYLLILSKYFSNSLFNNEIYNMNNINNFFSLYKKLIFILYI